MFYQSNGKWLLQENKGSILGKEKFYTFGFAAEVMYE
jgi:hypothetical protein